MVDPAYLLCDWEAAERGSWEWFYRKWFNVDLDRSRHYRIDALGYIANTIRLAVSIVEIVLVALVAASLFAKAHGSLGSTMVAFLILPNLIIALALTMLAGFAALTRSLGLCEALGRVATHMYASGFVPLSELLLNAPCSSPFTSALSCARCLCLPISIPILLLVGLGLIFLYAVVSIMSLVAIVLCWPILFVVLALVFMVVDLVLHLMVLGAPCWSTETTIFCIRMRGFKNLANACCHSLPQAVLLLSAMAVGILDRGWLEVSTLLVVVLSAVSGIGTIVVESLAYRKWSGYGFFRFFDDSIFPESEGTAWAHGGGARVM